MQAKLETNSPDINFFGQIMAVLHEEELLRLRKRFQMRGNAVMVEVLTDELEERQLGREHRPVPSA